jgi:spectinomycin phosphotransferase
MLDKPRLEDGKIIACVRATYGLTITEIEFLPLGYDSYAGVYRVEAGGETYFLKARRDAVDELSILLPQFLKSQGMDQVVAPLPTITPDPWGKIEGFTLILYPFIAGTNCWGADLSDSQWIALGEGLRQLHATQLPPDLLNRMPKETFIPHAKWMPLIKHLHIAVEHRMYDHPVQQQLAAFWRDHHRAISSIIERTEQLGNRLQRESRDDAPVLCHADIHTGNVLCDAQGRLFIVDWDQPILAPRERDLMFVTVGGFVTQQRAETLIFQGYGATEIDPLIMAYYRYERTMQDLAAFAEQVFLADSSDETRQDSVNWFMVQFAPGGLAEGARACDQIPFS